MNCFTESLVEFMKKKKSIKESRLSLGKWQGLIITAGIHKGFLRRDGEYLLYCGEE